MKQYKTTVGEDLATQFYQKVSGSLKEIRYATAPELAIKPKTWSVSVQTEELYINTSITSEVSINETSQEPPMSTPGIPSRRKKKTADSNNCTKCQIRYGSKIDDKYGLIWINCSAKNCQYWVHLYCIGISCDDEDQEEFGKLVKYFCKLNNPHKVPRPKGVLKKH